MQAQCIYQSNQQLAEGPLWHQGQLYWVDIKGHELHRLSPCIGEHEVRAFPEQATSILPRASGGFVITVRHGFGFIDDFYGPLVYLGDVETDPDNRFNDAKVDSFGCLWAGSMDDGEERASGCLYRIASNNSWQKADTGYVITNGPAFAPDCTYLYHTDTLKRTIYRFKCSGEGIREKEVFLKLPESEGYPDGMTVDADGNLWVCQFGGWGISQFSADGDLIRKYDLPVANVTSCTFGGDALDTLFITTAAKGLDQTQLAEQPMAGSIFSMKVDAVGVPVKPFLG